MAQPDVITVDNLPEKLSAWNHNDENHLYAIVDMGSNGIRFSITSLEPPRARLLQPLYSTRAAISLFDALTPAPEGLIFPPATIQAVSSTLAGFRNLADLHGVSSSNIMILATEAMRRAANAPDILKAIADSTGGLGVHILDPAVETLCGAVMGSRSGLVDVKGGALFLDLGGGSVQMTWVDTTVKNYGIESAKAGISLPFGAAKLTRVLENEDAQVQTKQVDTLKNGLREAFLKLCSTFPSLGAIQAAYERGEDTSIAVYMCGGGFRGYGSLLMHNDPIKPYPIPNIGTYSVDSSQFKQTAEMRAVNRDHDGKIFGMSKRRRKQFPAIATVVEAFIAAVPSIGRVTFCAGSNREGALMMKLPVEIRESNPLDVLANVQESERPGMNVVLRKLSEALPKEVELNKVPSIFNLGLGELFIRDIWSRQGHDADTNSSFALHNAVSRDSNAPGLTHLSRAVLGLTSIARWNGDLGYGDSELFQGLRAIVESHHKDAFFWTQYLGAVASLLVNICPSSFARFDRHEPNISVESRIDADAGKKEVIHLKIGIASDIATNLETEDMVERLKAVSKKGNKQASKKISPHIAIFV